MYFQRWETLDKKYKLMDKWEYMVCGSKDNYRKVKQFEKKHEIGDRVMGFVLHTIGSTADLVGKTTTTMTNSKRRHEMIQKLPVNKSFVWLCSVVVIVVMRMACHECPVTLRTLTHPTN